jgi:RNA polymerase sigma-70 factor (ECF subfamily)
MPPEPEPSPPTLEVLLERHHSRLLAFVRLRASPFLLAHESSSDLAQSVCREAMMHGGAFLYHGDEQFMGWLTTIALTKLIDRSRHYGAKKRNQGARIASLDTLTPGEEGALGAAYRGLGTPSQSASQREEIARVEAALGRLSESHREVILLARIMRLPHKEIAAHMGRTEVAVRQLLARALAQLSELLT